MAVTMMRAGPVLRSGTASRSIVRVTRTLSTDSCFTSADPGEASEKSGVCLPFCSNAIVIVSTFAPGAEISTSTGVDCPTYLVGLAISTTGPGSRPA